MAILSTQTELSLLEKKLQKKLFPKPPFRESINCKELLGFKKILCIGFAIFLPFWILDNIIYGVDCLIKKVPFKLLPFTSINSATPYLGIARLDKNIKIEMRFQEHPPPHFHVIIGKEDYALNLLTGEQLQGSLLKPKEMDISVMLTPHFGDIDPPHRNGSKNR